MTATLTIRPARALQFLLILAFAMSVLGITATIVETTFDVETEESEGVSFIWPIARQFNFVEEGNLANFYQGLQLVLASLLLFIIWRTKRGEKKFPRVLWLLLALGFLFLGIDEVAQVHDTTVMMLINEFKDDDSTKTDWMWLYLPVVGIMALAYLPFLSRLPRRIAILMVSSGATYLSGVIVMEKVANWYAKKYNDGSLGYTLIDGSSELLESCGIAIFIYTLLSYLAMSTSDIRIRLTSPSAGDADTG